jgi:biotin carboxyl carrier protein
MKFEIELGDKTRTVELARMGALLRCTIDGRTIEADVVGVAPGIYSILIGGESFEAQVEPYLPGLRIMVAGREYSARIRDPRHPRRSRGAALEAEGRQEVRAPMPGKVIRVLRKPGDPIEAGQGLLVVEAMKMQNEVRSPKSGRVERLLVAEGSAVNAGEVLAVIN